MRDTYLKCIVVCSPLGCVFVFDHDQAGEMCFSLAETILMGYIDIKSFDEMPKQLFSTSYGKGEG